MKRYICTVILAVISITVAQAQRMLPRQKGLEINAGALSAKKPGGNYYLNAGLTVSGKNGNYQLWMLEYSHEYAGYKNLHIPLETYTAEGGYSLKLLADHGKNITCNAAVTAVAGYETINRGTDMLYDGAKILNKEHFIYGPAGVCLWKLICVIIWFFSSRVESKPYGGLLGSNSGHLQELD